MGSDHDASVTHDSTASRYELRVGEEVVGVATYRWDGGRLVLDHTVVDGEHREQGMGTVLAQGVLDDLRERGLRAVPECPFIAAYLQDHPEYADVVDEVPDDV